MPATEHSVPKDQYTFASETAIAFFSMMAALFAAFGLPALHWLWSISVKMDKLDQVITAIDKHSEWHTHHMHSLATLDTRTIEHERRLDNHEHRLDEHERRLDSIERT